MQIKKIRTRTFARLVVSAGHTHLCIVKDYGAYEIFSYTKKDAAGENRYIPFSHAKVNGLDYDFNFSRKNQQC